MYKDFLDYDNEDTMMPVLRVIKDYLPEDCELEEEGIWDELIENLNKADFNKMDEDLVSALNEVLFLETWKKGVVPEDAVEPVRDFIGYFKLCYGSPTFNYHGNPNDHAGGLGGFFGMLMGNWSTTNKKTIKKPRKRRRRRRKKK